MYFTEIETPPECSLPADRGPCKGRFQKWYYENAIGGCTTFIYGGCQGNRNRFQTKEDCEKKCAKKKVVPTVVTKPQQPPTAKVQTSQPLVELCKFAQFPVV